MLIHHFFCFSLSFHKVNVSSSEVVIYADNILSEFIVNSRHYRADDVYVHYLIYIDDLSLQSS